MKSAFGRIHLLAKGAFCFGLFNSGFAAVLIKISSEDYFLLLKRVILFAVYIVEALNFSGPIICCGIFFDVYSCGIRLLSPLKQMNAIFHSFLVNYFTIIC
jgi:hypothetical protein